MSGVGRRGGRRRARGGSWLGEEYPQVTDDRAVGWPGAPTALFVVRSSLQVVFGGNEVGFGVYSDGVVGGGGDVDGDAVLEEA